MALTHKVCGQAVKALCLKSLDAATDTGSVLLCDTCNVTVTMGECSGTYDGTTEIYAVQQGDKAETFGSASSHQVVAADMTLDAGAGKDIATGTAFLAPIMGNLWCSATLTKSANYLGGLIGHYSVTGVGSSTFPKGAVLAGIGDGSEDADGAVVAYIDGDSAVTKAGAAFKVRCNNSTAGSGFNYGLDLQDASHDGFSAVSYLKAPVRLGGDVVLMHNAGVPDASVGATFAGKASLCVDLTNGNLYINTGDKTTPAWKVVPFTP